MAPNHPLHCLDSTARVSLRLSYKSLRRLHFSRQALRVRDERPAHTSSEAERGAGSTDGSHPSDLGMVRYADAYEPALRSILRQY